MSSYTSDKLIPLGDAAVLIQAGDQIDLATHRRVQAIASYLEDHPFPGLVEYVPAFTTITVYYDPMLLGLQFQTEQETLRSPYQFVCHLLNDILVQIAITAESEPRIVEIPVSYGGAYGPDLEAVAEHNGLTPEEVIEIHTSAEYLVYMIGFAPGFPYLGGLPERIATPRRPSPRLSIPAGTVGIAGNQTGVYPIATPGGWQLIGKTPLPLFRAQSNSPSLLQAGDKVRFYPITADEFVAWKEAAPTWDSQSNIRGF